MPKTAWEYLNAPLIAGLIQALATALIGGLIVSLLVGVTISWLSKRWEDDRKRRELQFTTFRTFNERSADLVTRSADLYHLRGAVPNEQFHKEAREMAYRKLMLLQMDAELVGIFADQTLFDDLLRVKEYSDAFSQAINQRPDKAPIQTLELAQNRFLWQTKIMKMKMLLELGLMSQEDCDKGIRLLQERLRTGDPGAGEPTGR